MTTFDRKQLHAALTAYRGGHAVHVGCGGEIGNVGTYCHGCEKAVHEDAVMRPLAARRILTEYGVHCVERGS